jgi:hypothetical protein
MMDEENINHRYFDIDRNLNSSDVASLVSALNGLNDLLSELKDRSFINTILLRLVSLMTTMSNFYIKNKIRMVLERHSKLVCEAINKTEIINSLTYQLNASDKLTRIIYLKVIGRLPQLFKHEISTYHHLITRMHSSDRHEKIEVFKCLKSILSVSRDLSRIFASNIQQILSNPQTSRLLVVRICRFARLENKEYFCVV